MKSVNLFRVLKHGFFDSLAKTQKPIQVTKEIDSHVKRQTAKKIHPGNTPVVLQL